MCHYFFFLSFLLFVSRSSLSDDLPSGPFFFVVDYVLYCAMFVTRDS